MKREIKKAEVTSYHVLSLLPSIQLHQIQGQQQIKRGGRNEAAPVEQLALSTFLLGNANNATDGGPKTWSSGCCGGPTLPTLSSFMRGGRLGERPRGERVCEDMSRDIYARGLAGGRQGTDLGYAICTWGLA
jgi:hypothetical protein